MLTGLQQLNIELTSRCDKNTLCFMCGHQGEGVAIPRGDMDLDLFAKIILQLQSPIIVSFHRDGDPLAYPHLSEALWMSQHLPTSIVTHGERLGEMAAKIINRCTTVTVSVIPRDPDREIQLASVREFLKVKGDRGPMVQLKFVGTIDDAREYEDLGVPIIGRALHSKKGSFQYRHVEPVVPEIRVCLDFLSRPTVDWQGNMSICNRLDLKEEGILGNLNNESLDSLWNGPVRQRMLRAHLAGRRGDANALCAGCAYWGIPSDV